MISVKFTAKTLTAAAIALCAEAAALPYPALCGAAASGDAAPGEAAPPAIEFAFSDDASPALPSELRADAPVPIDDGERKALGAKYLVRAADAGGGRELLMVCADATASGELRGIQLLTAERRDGKRRALSRIKLGNGTAPEVIRPDGSRDMLARVLRSGGKAECVVLTLDEESGKLTPSLRINSAMPETQKLSIKATLKAGGGVEIKAARPAHNAELDLSYALEALKEDGIYQEDGRPIPALVNLKCERQGWEGEAIRLEGGAAKVDVGMTLATPSKKQVVTATVTFARDGAGRWAPESMTCEPFMPYRDQ